MRAKVAIVKNIGRLMDAYDAIEQRDAGVEGMCLVYGSTGVGKTTALSFLMNRKNAIYVEASPAWTLTSMLASIVRAVGIEPHGRAADLESVIVDEMAIKGRPLFIDELDHMLLPGQTTTLRMLESLRSIYDKSRMPIVMVGMSKIDRKIKLREQLARRVFQWVEFHDLDREDIRITATDMCEIPVDDGFVEYLFEQTQGRMGRVVLGLAQAERTARGNRWSSISMQRWGNRTLQLGR